MKKVLSALLFASLVQAEDKKPLGELYREKLLRIEAQAQLLEVQAQKLAEERVAAWKDACTAAGIADLQACNVDVRAGLVWKEEPKK
jgi:hypothetical protein